MTIILIDAATSPSAIATMLDTISITTSKSSNCSRNNFQNGLGGSLVSSFLPYIPNLACASSEDNPCTCVFCFIWFGLVWFGLVWFGLVWFGLRV